ncbi:hypothetical protein FZC35_01760 [Candidatus Cytomitobacter indipagum]|uniref:Uncharacterized protein n=1 Tax=Candidatus Cytomitobacter indipagum TaxID=2601575 RepID=A0A5C0UDH9_9PROT|nr:hypothetical protein [Candidatus Cytomitobacter indipagum]QEK38095.1 hypothetical protein FZC35_01760 [Candidatus Cytomitobacter indipagum]
MNKKSLILLACLLSISNTNTMPAKVEKTASSVAQDMFYSKAAPVRDNLANLLKGIQLAIRDQEKDLLFGKIVLGDQKNNFYFSMENKLQNSSSWFSVDKMGKLSKIDSKKLIAGLSKANYYFNITGFDFSKLSAKMDGQIFYKNAEKKLTNESKAIDLGSYDNGIIGNILDEIVGILKGSGFAISDENIKEEKEKLARRSARSSLASSKVTTPAGSPARSRSGSAFATSPKNVSFAGDSQKDGKAPKRVVLSPSQPSIISESLAEIKDANPIAESLAEARNANPIAEISSQVAPQVEDKRSIETQLSSHEEQKADLGFSEKDEAQDLQDGLVSRSKALNSLSKPIPRIVGDLIEVPTTERQPTSLVVSDLSELQSEASPLGYGVAFASSTDVSNRNSDSEKEDQLKDKFMLDVLQGNTDESAIEVGSRTPRTPQKASDAAELESHLSDEEILVDPQTEEEKLDSSDKEILIDSQTGEERLDSSDEETLVEVKNQNPAELERGSLVDPDHHFSGLKRNPMLSKLFSEKNTLRSTNAKSAPLLATEKKVREQKALLADQQNVLRSTNAEPAPLVNVKQDEEKVKIDETVTKRLKAAANRLQTLPEGEKSSLAPSKTTKENSKKLAGKRKRGNGNVKKVVSKTANEQNDIQKDSLSGLMKQALSSSTKNTGNDFAVESKTVELKLNEMVDILEKSDFENALNAIKNKFNISDETINYVRNQINNDASTKSNKKFIAQMILGQEKKETLAKVIYADGQKGKGRYGLRHYDSNNNSLFQIKAENLMKSDCGKILKEMNPALYDHVTKRDDNTIPYLLFYVNKNSEHHSKMVIENNNGDIVSPLINPYFKEWLRNGDKNNDGLVLMCCKISIDDLVGKFDKTDSLISYINSGNSSIEGLKDEELQDKRVNSMYEYLLKNLPSASQKSVLVMDTVDSKFHNFMKSKFSINVAGSDNKYNIKEVHTLKIMHEVLVDAGVYSA